MCYVAFRFVPFSVGLQDINNTGASHEQTSLVVGRRSLFVVVGRWSLFVVVGRCRSVGRRPVDCLFFVRIDML